MKTTLEIPDSLFRQAKMAAAREGTTLRAVVTRALMAELVDGSAFSAAPAWRKSFGGLRHLHGESSQVDAAVEEAFEQIDEDVWK